MGINWKKIRKLLGKKHKPKKSRPYTTEEIKRMLHSTKDLRSKALILFLAASGVRRGAIPELKIKHLKQMSNHCLEVTVYEGSNEEYVTFINTEAREALNLYLKRRKHDGEHLDPEHPVFRAKYQLAIAKPKPFSEKYYDHNRVFCRQCERFMKIPTVRCPCCKSSVRNRARSKK